MSTVFWSWQSDLDPRVTRHVIRDALAAAIDGLAAELDERHELTSDTQGVPGSPDIVATILAKIDAAAVFVGDVTHIAVSAGQKAVANPNVLIELGYAKKSLGLGRVITVWNTAFEGATVEQLPFDMRGRRGPTSFHLASDATTPELRAARDKLSAQLLTALKASIATVSPTEEGPQLRWQDPDPSTPALWFAPDSELTINEDGVPGRKAIHPGPHCYVRILPTRWTVPARFGDGRAGHPAILGPTQGFSWGTTRGGLLTYTGSIRADQRRPLVNFVMVFRATGEIWGVSPFMSDGKEDGRFWADAVISHAHDFIESNIDFLIAQGAGGPFEVRIGVADLAGLHWTTDTRWGGHPVALEADAEATLRIVRNTEAERLDALEPAWGNIAAAFGVTQPPREILVRQIRGF